MNRWTIMAATAAAFCLPVAAQTTWPETAKADLAAIHALIESNHPGPVDPANPQFHTWLEQGYALALAEAKTARSQGDYERALRVYVNGFQDGHVGLTPKSAPAQLRWTGFSVFARTADDIRVVYAEPDAGVNVGDRLITCDGKNIDALLTQRTDRYYWNAAIPHARYLHASRLFVQTADDTQATLKTCTFSSETVTLQWRHEATATAQTKLKTGLSVPNVPQLRVMDGVWVISVPTFAIYAEKDIAAFTAFLDAVAAHRSELQTATVVVDVRRNSGGSSAWGDKLAAALWGTDWLSYVHKKSQSTVEFRASAGNLATIDERIASLSAHEGPDSAVVRYFTKARAAITTALQKKQPLARLESTSEPAGDPPPNPMQGKVYFLTDYACGSACLDFADVVRQMPGVIHIGLPTSADSVYMEVASKPLPSGLFLLNYPMKVYRNRPRKNNEYYVPQVLWTGGPMTDNRAIVAWVKSLP